eukprot:GFKZ01013346.1.p1 GENE.GFKZ01013346.1~~GFKZ01013346.1.p1  ORF type:complete len:139 (+),score=12.89 GFKZ01013346.1:254-670(+)
MCSAALPEGVPYDFALIALVVNIFFPGIGTMITSCFGTRVDASTLLIGILQLFTAPILVGWIWAIVWGVNLTKKAKEEENIKNNPHQAPTVTQPPPVHASGPTGPPPQTGVPVDKVPPPPYSTAPPGAYPPPPPPAPQ